MSILFLHGGDWKLHCPKLLSLGEETQLSVRSFLSAKSEPSAPDMEIKSLRARIYVSTFHRLSKHVSNLM